MLTLRLSFGLLLVCSLAASACGRSELGDPSPTPTPKPATPDAGPLFYQPPASDASVPTSLPPSDDASAAAQVDPDPLAHCAPSSRDTLYVNVSAPLVDIEGTYAPGPVTFTNLDSNWTPASPFEIDVHRVSGDDGIVNIATADGRPLAPGRYTLGSESAPSLQLMLGYWNEQCAAVSGTLDVLDSRFDTEDAGAVPSSTLLSFDIQCGNARSAAPVPIQGCVRFTTSLDAGVVPPASALADGGDDDGEDGGDVLAPCASGGYLFHVDDPSGVGSESVSGAVGTWSAGVNYIPGPLLQLEADLWPPWELDFGADVIAPGTYTLSGGNEVNPWLTFAGGGTGCGQATGTVTIASMQTTSARDVGHADRNVTQLLMGFDVTCFGGGHPVRGCVSFGAP